MALLDWSQCPAVESIPGKVSGAWVLRNTRMPVATIFENLEAGANIDDILAWYDGLDRDQVKAVIEFAARSLDTPVASRAVPPDILHFPARVAGTPTDAPHRPRVVEWREETTDDQVHADHAPPAAALRPPA